MPRKFYDKESTLEKRRILKTNQTKTEAMLWNKLRDRQLLNLKFRRQYGIGEYITDFYCSEIKLVIELDGSQHFTDDGKEYDQVRTDFFNSLNIKVIRFGNNQILTNIDSVVQMIETEIRQLKQMNKTVD